MTQHYYALTDREALIAFEAIARDRHERKCDCDSDVGYECRQHEVMTIRGKRHDWCDGGQQRMADLYYRWALVAIEARRKHAEATQ